MKLDDLIDDYEITTLSVWGVRSRNSELFSGFTNKLNEFEGVDIYQKVKSFILSCGVNEEDIKNSSVL